GQSATLPTGVGRRAAHPTTPNHFPCPCTRESVIRLSRLEYPSCCGVASSHRRECPFDEAQRVSVCLRLGPRHSGTASQEPAPPPGPGQRDTPQKDCQTVIVSGIQLASRAVGEREGGGALSEGA